MKKQERKENANKGFSLVELIVVVAIMAVLIGVLAPQYLRYVEKTRLQKDNSAIAEIANAIKIAMADETINNNTTSGTTVTLANASATDNAKITFGTTDGTVEKELSMVIGASYETSSNAYKASNVPIKLTITKDANTGIVTVSATGWIEAVGDTPIAADADLANQKKF